MSIQSAINSMITSTSRAMVAVKLNQDKLKKRSAADANKLSEIPITVPRTSPQEIAAQRAKQSVQDATNAKRKQRRNFREYLGEQPSSLGPVSKLPASLQNQIAAQFSRSQRQRLMNKMDEETTNGKHRQRNGTT